MLTNVGMTCQIAHTQWGIPNLSKRLPRKKVCKLAQDCFCFLLQTSAILSDQISPCFGNHIQLGDFTEWGWDTVSWRVCKIRSVIRGRRILLSKQPSEKWRSEDCKVNSACNFLYYSKLTKHWFSKRQKDVIFWMNYEDN